MEFKCEKCEKELKSKAGLSAHMRFGHKETVENGQNPLQSPTESPPEKVNTSPSTESGSLTITFPKKKRSGMAPGVGTLTQLTPLQLREIHDKGLVPRIVNAGTSPHARAIMQTRVAQGYKPYKLDKEDPLLEELFGKSASGGSRFGDSILMVCPKEYVEEREAEKFDAYVERMKQRKGFKKSVEGDSGLVYGSGITTEVEHVS